MNGGDAESRALVWQWLEYCLTLDNNTLQEDTLKVICYNIMYFYATYPH